MSTANLPSIVVVSDIDGRKFKMVLRGALEKLSVSKIKHYLEQSTKIPANQQLIHIDGNILEDHQVGADFGLRPDDVLHLNTTSAMMMSNHSNNQNNTHTPPATPPQSRRAPQQQQQNQQHQQQNLAADQNRNPMLSPPMKVADELAAIRSSLDADALAQFENARNGGNNNGVIPAANPGGNNSNVYGGSSYNRTPSTASAATASLARNTIHTSLQEPVQLHDAIRNSNNNYPQRAAPSAPSPSSSAWQPQHHYDAAIGAPSTALADQQVSNSLLVAENAQLKKEIDKLRGKVSALEAANAACDPRHPGGFPPGGVLAAARVQLAGLSQELGAALEFDDNFTCVIGSDDSTILVTVDTQTERLYVYSTLLSALPADERKCAQIYRALLEWSMLGRDMAGGGVGIDAQTGIVILSTSIDLRNARPPALRDTAPVFVESLVRWRQTLSTMLNA